MPSAYRIQGAKQLNYEYDDGFYYLEGYYFWDGTPPPGEPLAHIYTATSTSVAPEYGTAGYVLGIISFYGDAFKLSWEVDASGYDGAAQTHWLFWDAREFVTSWIGCTQRCTSSSATQGWIQSLSLPYNPEATTQHTGYCDVHVTTTGLASAKHNSPWGIPIWLLRKIPPTEGDWYDPVHKAMVGSSDMGGACDLAPTPAQQACDNEETEELEACPPYGAPEAPASQGGGSMSTSGTYGAMNEWPAFSGASFVCTEWWHMKTTQNGVVLEEWYDCITWEIHEY